MDTETKLQTATEHSLAKLAARAAWFVACVAYVCAMAALRTLDLLVWLQIRVLMEIHGCLPVNRGSRISCYLELGAIDEFQADGTVVMPVRPPQPTAAEVKAATELRDASNTQNDVRLTLGM